MKQSVFMTVIIVVSLVVSAIIFYAVFGNPANFKTPDKNTPANIMGAIYLGFIYFIASAIGLVVFLININKKIKAA